jgi:hypothetical protein
MAVISGSALAAVNLRRRSLHSGRMVANSDTNAAPTSTAREKPKNTSVQLFMGAG